MDGFIIFLVQGLNSVQYGLLLFLIASGLTLVFGIMNVINLAHGAFYMLGGYIAFSFVHWTGSIWLAFLLTVPLGVAIGFVVERLMITFLYDRDHLDQVLLTFALILLANEMQRALWGSDPHSLPIPELLRGSIQLTDRLAYPVYRLFLSGICLVLAVGLFLVIQRTRLGMVIRAGSVNREMVQALGINIRWLNTLVFSAGAALAAFAGAIAAPVNTIYPGVGDSILIISFVVIVIGGIGSIKGAFVAALLIGFVDTFGKVLAPDLAGIAVYALMGFILLFRPQGLFRSSA